MDAIISVILEAIIDLVFYFVELMKWWRFTVCLLVAIGGTVAIQVMGSQRDIGVLSLLAVILPVVGVAGGLFWEYRAHHRPWR